MLGMNDPGAKPRPAARSGSVEKLATFIFGVAFLAVMLGLALLVPNPSESQSFIFRVVAAAAAGGAVVFLPGAVNVTIKPSIRAGGAFAVFALVYAFNPPKTTTAPQPPPATNKYTLELRLSFDPAERLKLDPFRANIQALVNDALTFSDYPGSQDAKLRSKAVRRGSGGIVVAFSDLTAGDKLAVVVEQDNQSWRSDEMKMPEANLTMNAISRPAHPVDGQP